MYASTAHSAAKELAKLRCVHFESRQSPVVISLAKDRIIELASETNRRIDKWIEAESGY